MTEILPQSSSPAPAIGSQSTAITDGQRQYACDYLQNSYPRLWLAVYHHRNTRNESMNFFDRPWLVDVYKDNSKHIVIVKCSQVGISEYAIISMMAHAMAGRPGIYILPSDRIVYEFTPRRLDNIIQRTPFYLNNCAPGAKQSDTKSQKTLFKVDWNIVGSNSVVNFYEKPVDVLIYDEFDKCNAGNLLFARDRIGSSAEDYSLTIGNPTMSGWGIEAEFDKTDRKQWHVKCEHCGKWQPIGWFENVVTQGDDGSFLFRSPVVGSAGRLIACRFCNGAVDRLAEGEWVAECQSDKSGYRINRVFADGRTNRNIIAELMDEFRAAQFDPTRMQIFYNNRLGLPYQTEGSCITPGLLQSCVDPAYVIHPYDPGDYSGSTVAGVDVGSHLHVNISRIVDGVRRKVFIGTVRDYESLADLVRIYKVTTGVIDALPEVHSTLGFISQHPGWYACYYRTAADKTVDLSINYREQTVTLERTRCLDMSKADYHEHRVILPNNIATIDDGQFVAQMCASIREFDEDKGVYKWNEYGKADHYRHADSYEKIAASIYSMSSNLVTVIKG